MTPVALLAANGLRHANCQAEAGMNEGDSCKI
jgi:hypothetical protein